LRPSPLATQQPSRLHEGDSILKMTNLTISTPIRIVNPAGRTSADSHSLHLENNTPHAAFAVGLGNDALISAKRYQRSASQFKNENKFALLDFARLILQKHDVRSSKTGKEHRTRFCLASRIDATQDVGITLNDNPDKSRAGFSNLQTCRSICSCPVCAERLMLEHAQDVKKALIWAENEGYYPVLVSLTASHHSGMKLVDFKAQFKAAWRMFSNHRTWRDYKSKFGIEHWFANRECTREAFGDNGWHYHMHMLVFISRGSLFNAGLPEDMGAKFTDFWLQCLDKNGLTGSREHACDVRAGAGIGADYLTKLGVTETVKGDLEYEITGGGNKGKNVWRVLEEAMFGDIRSEYLYLEYVQAMQGENWITTSHGFRDLIADIELPVSEGSVDERERLILWMNITIENWRVVVANRAIAGVLRIAATYRDENKVLEYIEDLREDDKARRSD